MWKCMQACATFSCRIGVRDVLHSRAAMGTYAKADIEVRKITSGCRLSQWNPIAGALRPWFLPSRMAGEFKWI
jgi:hypothetical protein